MSWMDEIGMTDLQKMSRRLNARWFPPLQITCSRCRQQYRENMGWGEGK